MIVHECFSAIYLNYCKEICKQFILDKPGLIQVHVV